MIVMPKLRNINLMEIICSITSPTTTVLFSSTYYSHLLLVVSLDMLMGLQKNHLYLEGNACYSEISWLVKKKKKNSGHLKQHSVSDVWSVFTAQILADKD